VGFEPTRAFAHTLTGIVVLVYSFQGIAM